MIRVLTNADPDFYPLMGPYLSRRSIVDAIGGPVWDDDGKTWAVAIVDGKVAGFCGLTVTGRKAVACSAYVPSDERETWAELLATITSEARKVADTVTATVAGELVAFKRAGFKPGATRGRFTVVTKTF